LSLICGGPRRVGPGNSKSARLGFEAGLKGLKAFENVGLCCGAYGFGQ